MSKHYTRKRGQLQGAICARGWKNRGVVVNDSEAVTVVPPVRRFVGWALGLVGLAGIVLVTAIAIL